MAERVAIIAGAGRLPAILAAGLDHAGDTPVIAALQGSTLEDIPEGSVERFRVERLAVFLDRLHALGVGRVVFAGAVQRPRLDPEAFDPRTAAMVPRLLAAIQGGDDATLREVVAIFEEDGLQVIGAAEAVPDLVPGEGVLGAVTPTKADAEDAARAARIVSALGAVDVGQGAVVAQGLCLALEALPGTDVMLAQLAELPAMRPDPEGARGLLYKAPKPEQDRRVDLPAIGPHTVTAAARAGLGGIAFEAGGVMVIDRAETVRRADARGLFLWAR